MGVIPVAIEQRIVKGSKELAQHGLVNPPSAISLRFPHSFLVPRACWRTCWPPRLWAVGNTHI